jgi:hypothetical protein
MRPLLDSEAKREREREDCGGHKIQNGFPSKLANIFGPARWAGIIEVDLDRCKGAKT